MLKKKFCALGLLLSIMSSTAFSAEKNVLSSNVLGLILGSINGTYEFALDEKTGIGLSGYFFSRTFGDWKWSGVGFGGAYNIYPAKKALKGIFVGPSLSFSRLSFEYTTTPWWGGVETTETSDSTFITIGGNFGHRWIWEGGFTLGLALGVGYTIGEVVIGDKTAPYGGIGLSRLSFDLGYAW